ncbi:hypothetical protein [Streptomyces sp. NPDC004546]|uniref:hypothetical protein n=1 Tax=unclassified Streptomyces TaxID=2593676 RepID=UPI0033A170B3
MPITQQLPIPRPHNLIPGATGTAALHTAHRQTTLTAGSSHTTNDAVNDAARAAITCLVHNREVAWDAHTGPLSLLMHGVRGEERSRELAAAFPRLVTTVGEDHLGWCRGSW